MIRTERRAGQMAEFLKFFSEDFGAEPRCAAMAAEPEPETIAMPEAPDPVLLASRDAAYQDGLRDGLQQAAASHEATLARAMAALEQSCTPARSPRRRQPIVPPFRWHGC